MEVAEVRHVVVDSVPAAVVTTTAGSGERLDYLTNNELGLSFLVNDEENSSDSDVDEPVYSEGHVELNFTVDLAGTAPPSTLTAPPGIAQFDIFATVNSQFAITDLADIEGDDYVIKSDSNHYNLIQYHINGNIIKIYLLFN